MCLAVYFNGKKKLKGFTGRMVMRTFVFALIVFALSDVVITKRTADVTTVFLVDVSDSTVSCNEEMELMIRKNMKKLPKDNRMGIVAFGSDSRVEQFVTDRVLFQELQTKPVTTATNMEQAVQSAMALFPENSAKRLVLITDGNENAGGIHNMETNLKTNQVEVMVWKLDTKIENEVYISDMRVPEKIQIGDVFSIQVEIESDIVTDAVLHLQAGTEIISSKQISLQKGTNSFVFQEECTQPGIAGYRVWIEPNQDTVSVNNEYVAFTEIEEKNKVLLIEGSQGKADAFVPVLEAANIDYKRILPEIAPDNIYNMNIYSCILLLDVYADDLSQGFLDNLEGYVKDYAGGLIAIGGENSFALGNYKDTPLETVLPVYMDLRGEKEIPQMAIAMVIDHSGSMSAGEGSVTKLQLAKEAAVQALDSLRESDLVGVLAFDDAFHWAAPIQSAGNKDEVTLQIDSISVAGGTSIYPAVEEARKQLEESSAKIKHIILLTDGQDGFREYEDLINQINEGNITLSTVAVGEGADTDLLSQLADSANGRYYYTDINSDVPRIFAKEVFLSVGEYIKNNRFTPIITSGTEILSDVAGDGLPTLLGYIASTKKELAAVHLISDEEDPILTTWQYGLGKTAAFNSDGENKWTARYAGWNKYPLLWKNIIEWCITDKSNENSSVYISQKGNQAHIKYEIKDYSAGSTATAVCTDEKGNSLEIAMDATAPGTFEADVVLDTVGIYGLNVTLQEEGTIKDTKNTAMALQYSAEYRFAEDKSVLDDFVSSVKGSFITKESAIFDKEPERVNTVRTLKHWLLLLAAFLFFIDIANRRFYPSLIERVRLRFAHIKETKIEKTKVRKQEKVNGINQQIGLDQDIKIVIKKETTKESKIPNKNKKKKQFDMLDTGALLDRKNDRNR